MAFDPKIGGPRALPAAPAAEPQGATAAPAPAEPAAPSVVRRGWNAATANVERAWTAGVNAGRKLETALEREVRDLEFKLLAAPIKTGGADEKYDGAIVGAGGKTYPPATKLKDVAPFVPKNGEPHGLIVHVNGINTNLEQQAEALQKLADESGAAVVGVHNSTQGVLADLLQSQRDKWNRGYNAAARTLGDVLNDAVKNGQSVHLSGHSQGALIIARTLTNAKDVMEKGLKLPPDEVKRRMSLITVETFGGASSQYPDGARYTHFINKADPIPMETGLGLNGSHPGEGAVVYEFEKQTGDPVGNHSFTNIYLPERDRRTAEKSPAAK